MKLFHRRGLVGLFAFACALAFPAVAGASVQPHLVLTPSGPAGATGQTLTYNLSFSPMNPTSDSPASITTHFPAGLLADSTIDGGKCLTQTAQDPNCEVANGTVTLAPPGGPVPAYEYLVQPPKAGDVAGVLLAVGGQPGQQAGIADVTVRPGDAGLDVAFTNLPGPTSNPAQPQLTDLNLQLSQLRLPSSCAAEQMTVNTVSENGTNESTNAPFQSTGCPSQPYGPTISAQISAFGQPGSADVHASISQAPSEAASKTIELDLPSSLQPDLAHDVGCLLGSPCTVGTASAITPLAPAAALANGTVILGLVNGAPAITVSFPAPDQLSFTGTINTSNNSVTVNNVPDVPITSLSLNITHSQYGEVFTTTCAPSNVVAKFSGQGGQASTFTAPISYSGCTSSSPTVGSPTASASLSGLGARHPKLRLSSSHGSNAPKLKSVAIRLGSGLSFNSAGLVKHKRCTGKGSHRKCSTTIRAKGLSISGAKLKSIKLRGGKLVITFTRAVSSVTITVRRPLLTESKGLQKRLKKHKVKRLPVTVKVTDASGQSTAIVLHPKA